MPCAPPFHAASPRGFELQTVTSANLSPTSSTPSFFSFSFASSSFRFPAAAAKLVCERTCAALASNLVLSRSFSFSLSSAVVPGEEERGVEVEVALGAGRGEPKRGLSFARDSRSFSSFSAISRSLADTSIGLGAFS